MSDFAIADDIADGWRPLTEAEKGVATVQLGYASALIRQARPAVDSWVTAGLLNPTIPQFVAVQMVQRFFLNPEGRESGTRTIDDYTESWTLTDAVAAGGMAVTDDLLALLQPTTAHTASGNAFTIRGRAPCRAWDAEC
jgi:hypothetical protein